MNIVPNDHYAAFDEYGWDKTFPSAPNRVT